MHQDIARQQHELESQSSDNPSGHVHRLANEKVSLEKELALALTRKAFAETSLKKAENEHDYLQEQID